MVKWGQGQVRKSNHWKSNHQQGTRPDTGRSSPLRALKDGGLSFSAVWKQRAGGPHEAPSHTALFPAAWSKATAALYQSWTGTQAAKALGGRKRLQSLSVHAEPWQQHTYFQISIQCRRYQSLKGNLVRDEAQLLRAGMFTAAWWKSAKPYAVWSSAPWLFTNSVSRGPVGWAVPASLTNTSPSAGPLRGLASVIIIRDYILLYSVICCILVIIAVPCLR